MTVGPQFRRCDSLWTDWQRQDVYNVWLDDGRILMLQQASLTCVCLGTDKVSGHARVVSADQVAGPGINGKTRGMLPQ
eukprot:2327414-Amphidinium_carterae.1